MRFVEYLKVSICSSVGFLIGAKYFLTELFLQVYKLEIFTGGSMQIILCKKKLFAVQLIQFWQSSHSRCIQALSWWRCSFFWPYAVGFSVNRRWIGPIIWHNIRVDFSPLLKVINVDMPAGYLKADFVGWQIHLGLFERQFSRRNTFFHSCLVRFAIDNTKHSFEYVTRCARLADRFPASRRSFKIKTLSHLICLRLHSLNLRSTNIILWIFWIVSGVAG